MSLRMNLYGWSLEDFTDALGRNDPRVRASAQDLLDDSLQEPARSRGSAWLATLFERGHPMRQDRPPDNRVDHGGLLTVQMETEAHAFVAHCIARALARDDHLNLAGESSHYAHQSVVDLYDELSACRFDGSVGCPVEYFSWMLRLSNGSPLFGDDFRTEWSFYTIFTNPELAAMIPVFEAAAVYMRQIPEGLPPELAETIATRLSDQGRTFIHALSDWFGRIQRAGQDAFIMWW